MTLVTKDFLAGKYKPSLVFSIGTWLSDLTIRLIKKCDPAFTLCADLVNAASL